MFTRSGSTSTLAPDSTTSWMVFMPLHRPEKRLIAKACSPMSRMSCTLLGKKVGKPAGLEDVVALVRRGRTLGHVVVGGDGDHAAVADVPAMLACLKTSIERSTPGPLPYQMPNTPSYLALSLNRSSCWVPQTAVARRVR